MTLAASVKLMILPISGRFCGLTHDFRVPGDFDALWPLVQDSRGIDKTRDFAISGRFRGL